MAGKDSDIDPRTVPEYYEGLRAYAETPKNLCNKAIDKLCRYPSTGFSTARVAWWTGWYDARVEDRLGHIFNKQKKKEIEYL